jgi:hypothetical protein
MWLKPYSTEAYRIRQLKQTAKKSITIELNAYFLPFTLVNGMMQFPVNGGFNPIFIIISKTPNSINLILQLCFRQRPTAVCLSFLLKLKTATVLYDFL